MDEEFSFQEKRARCSTLCPRIQKTATIVYITYSLSQSYKIFLSIKKFRSFSFHLLFSFFFHARFNFLEISAFNRSCRFLTRHEVNFNLANEEDTRGGNVNEQISIYD